MSRKGEVQHIDAVLRRLRITITFVTVLFATIVMTAVFAVVTYNEYSSQISTVGKELERAIPATKAEELYDVFTDVVQPESVQENKNEPENTNGNLPKIGINSTFSFEKNVPILVYKYSNGTLTIVSNGNAELTTETFVSLTENFTKLSYGVARDSATSLLYCKKTVNGTSYIALTDVSLVDSYVEATIRACTIVLLILTFLFSVSAWFLSGWIVKPVKENWEKQRQFIADASHELKTPISVIMANSALIIDNKDTDAISKKWTQVTIEETNNMKHLVEEMLSLTAGHSVQEDLEQLDVAYEVTKTALAFEPRAFEKNCMLSYDDLELNCTVMASSAKFGRLMSILLDNACKYSKEGTTIEVSLHKHKGMALIQVIDEGTKIPKGQEEEIFGRFVRLDEARTRGTNGYGLGLTMAKDIVECYNGTIKAKTAGEKTIFSVQLPLVRKVKNDK